ncbi:MAG: nicotinamide-nucleotide amidohydrolase family protein, partial [Betaproteobacteria bacterium AqS2]|nr:nicotinamide-nucleotide amidohydrolase family protein [Betaproteobacteria bacterium AqS2]
KETYDHFKKSRSEITIGSDMHGGRNLASLTSLGRETINMGLPLRSYGPRVSPSAGLAPPPADLGRLALHKQARIAVAESCTGGLLGARLTEAAGASTWFAGGVIAYDEVAKQQVLGVRRSTLKKFGPVSAQTAFEMAAGVVKAMPGATHGVAITGWAGPDVAPGARRGKVCICCVDRGSGVKKGEFHFKGGRDAVREEAVEQALLLLGDLLFAK